MRQSSEIVSKNPIHNANQRPPHNILPKPTSGMCVNPPHHPRIHVGHSSDETADTGCTVILCKDEFVGGVHVPGHAPGSRELDVLRTTTTPAHVDGVVLSGGSAFGLASADGAMKFLAESNQGTKLLAIPVPIVPAAVVWDAACVKASSAKVEQGRIGAGMGTRNGKIMSLLGDYSARNRSGIGSSLVEFKGVKMGALCVVNSLGYIANPTTGEHISGLEKESGGLFSDEEMLQALSIDPSKGNTLLCVVATNCKLTKLECCDLARRASNGIVRSVRPAFLSQDGDVVFTLSRQEQDDNTIGNWKEIRTMNLLGELAARAVSQAIMNSVY
ncbi:putative P1 family peptidase [Blattamonas nauphoetae]|uniref:P1 family peptidase n=1 Tax=Blattamonas nauphoetae TaxID=2049346 RepID=A0ABQ9WXX8_9EUKA|nr:putative P1 family peptidase [Blattamonas nauphoetae]